MNMAIRKTAKTDDLEQRDANRDPITKEPGSHPVGTGIGAAVAGTAGTAIGAMAGPIGAVAGAVIGSAIGGAAGHGIGEAIDPTVEDTYWRENYAKRDYVTPGSTYNEYQPAYRYGWESATRYEARPYDEVEPDLSRDWENQRGANSRLEWDRARHATRDAYQRGSEQVRSQQAGRNTEPEQTRRSEQGRASEQLRNQPSAECKTEPVHH
jgi:hypothetical protein